MVEAGEVRDWHFADISIAVARVRLMFDGTMISRNRRILAAKPTAAAFIDPDFAGGRSRGSLNVHACRRRNLRRNVFRWLFVRCNGGIGNRFNLRIFW